MLERNAAEGVHRIEDAYVNFYLVEEGGRLTIVDTAHPASWSVLHGALHELGRSPADVDAVVLTHGHFDHMGFAERARREWRVPVWAHERERPVTRHPWRYDHERSRLPYLRHATFVKILAAMARAGAPRVKGAEEVRTHGSEGVLDVPGRPRTARRRSPRSTRWRRSTRTRCSPATGRRGADRRARRSPARAWPGSRSVSERRRRGRAPTARTCPAAGRGPARP